MALAIAGGILVSRLYERSSSINFKSLPKAPTISNDLIEHTMNVRN